MKNAAMSLSEIERDTLKQMIAMHKTPKIIIKLFQRGSRIRFSYASLKETTLRHFNMHWDIKKKDWVKCTPPHPSYEISPPIQHTFFTTSINPKQSENNPKPSSQENSTIEKPPLNSSKTYHCKINLNGKLKPITPLNELELAIASNESPYPLAIPGNDIITILKNIHFIEQTIKKIQQAINSMNHNLSILANYYNELD